MNLKQAPLRHFSRRQWRARLPFRIQRIRRLKSNQNFVTGFMTSVDNFDYKKVWPKSGVGNSVKLAGINLDIF